MKNLTQFSHMNHRSGYAVDIKLLRNNKEANLGGERMDETDSLNYYQTKQKLSKKEQTIKHNRELLAKTLTKYGFENYPNEWWHWGYREKYNPITY
jgi:D-alanyl-D-alanine dipeptidase